MINIVHNRGTGRAESATNYLLSEYGTVNGKFPTKSEQEKGIGKRDVEPRVLRGDVDTTVSVINANPHKKKYTSGCLSFEEENLSDEAKREIMDGFENVTFAGLDADQYQILWVEHRDKGRLELNYLIANQELQTGKSLTPYLHSRDKETINAWRETVDQKFNLASPDEPKRQQAFITPKDLPEKKKDAQNALNNSIENLVSAGAITNRDELVKTLEQHGFEVARQTKKSISIKDPDGGQNIRLTGAVYEQDFQFSESLRGNIQARATRYERADRERLRKAERTLEKRIEQKRALNESRYPRPEPAKRKKDKHESLDASANLPSRDNQRIDDYRPELVRKQKRDSAAIRDSEKQLKVGAMQPSHKIKKQHHQMSSGVKNDDSIRARIAEKFQRINETIRETAQRVTERAKKFRDDVREHIERQSKTENRSEELAKHAREFHKSAKPIVEQKSHENKIKRDAQAPTLTRTPTP